MAHEGKGASSMLFMRYLCQLCCLLHIICSVNELETGLRPIGGQLSMLHSGPGAEGNEQCVRGLGMWGMAKSSNADGHSFRGTEYGILYM